MERLRFYLCYSLRHMWRDKQRTAFALFCVAAGVAAIVGLQTLGLVVVDALTGDARAVNRGDVTVGPAHHGRFSEDQMAAFEQLVTDGLATVWTYRRFQDGLSMTVTVIRDEGSETFPFLNVFLVDPAIYPLYGQVLALDPPHASLAEMLVDSDDIVVSKNLADQRDIAVGDQLRFMGRSTLYTVRGVVPTGSAAFSRNIGPLANGFFYLDYATTVEAWGREWMPMEVFFATEDEAGAMALAERAAEIAPLSPVHTAADKLAQNKEMTTRITRYVLVFGLLAMLIGGIGIANTMQVVVARRRLEIAVLKALGFKGRHVICLFLSEAALLGLGGGLVGLLLGLAVSQTLVGLTQVFLSTRAAWQIYPQPLVTGLGLGVVVTVVFGFLPTLDAALIRPSLVLRPADGGFVRIGRWRSLVIVLLLTGVMGLLAGRLLSSWIGGLASAYGVLIVLTVLTGLLRIVVLVIERLPSFGWVSLRLAQRGIGRNRGRAASTLLALIVGLFSISLVVIFATSMLSNMERRTAEALGADLRIWTRDKATWDAVLQTLETSPYVHSFAQVGYFGAELIAINGDPEAYERRIAAYEQERGDSLTAPDRDELDKSLSTILGHDLSSNLPHFVALSRMGRNLRPDDKGRKVAIVAKNRVVAPLNLQPGETLTFLLKKDVQITLDIVGVIEDDADLIIGTVIAPLDILAAQATARERSLLVDVSPEEKAGAVTALRRSLPEGAFVFETGAILATYGRLYQQVVVLPVIVAALALFAAATMIANTAALAVIERRREIGVMKAVGVRGRRVLGHLLLESSIIGLAGGLISVGLVMMLLVLFSSELELPRSVDPWPILRLLALGIGVALASTFLAAWPASRRRPLEVLRYE